MNTKYVVALAMVGGFAGAKAAFAIGEKYAALHVFAVEGVSP